MCEVKQKDIFNLYFKLFLYSHSEQIIPVVLLLKKSSKKVFHWETVCPVYREMRWAPAKFALAQVASHEFISVTVPRASSASRHQNGSVHNTSLFAVTVRPTLIIYLLQFRLFSSIFHISSPHAPLPFTPLNGRRKKMYMCVSGIQCVVTMITDYTESNIARYSIVSNLGVYAKTKDELHWKF